MTELRREAGDLLVSDAEREQAVAALRAHLEDGRLTVDEFTSRVEAAFAARTRSELAEALRQLPEHRAEAAERPVEQRPGLLFLAARQAGYSALAVVVCTLIWAFTGAGGDFWPKWVILALSISFVMRVGKAALGDEDARARLERRHGGGALSCRGLPRPPRELPRDRRG